MRSQIIYKYDFGDLGYIRDIFFVKMNTILWLCLNIISNSQNLGFILRKQEIVNLSPNEVE